MIQKDFELKIEKAASAEYDGSWTISSTAIDRVGDTMDLKALHTQVGKDVICLWQHDPTQPIGKWTNLRVKGEQLVADLKLANTNLGKMIKELIAINTPLGASVGFRGRGEPNKKGGVHFKEIELLETSIVSVPCNREAMQIAKSFGVNIQSSDVGVDLVESDRNPDAVIDRAKAAILAANRTIRKKS